MIPIKHRGGVDRYRCRKSLRLRLSTRTEHAAASCSVGGWSVRFIEIGYLMQRVIRDSVSAEVFRSLEDLPPSADKSSIPVTGSVGSLIPADCRMIWRNCASELVLTNRHRQVCSSAPQILNRRFCRCCCFFAGPFNLSGIGRFWIVDIHNFCVLRFTALCNFLELLPCAQACARSENMCGCDVG